MYNLYNMPRTKDFLKDLYAKYPFSSRFEAFAKIVGKGEKKYKNAQASLEKLAGIFGEEVGVSINNNPDLLYITSNLIELNRINLNDDCVFAEDIIPYCDSFINKPFDLEHTRTEIVGAITDVGFSLSGSDDIISDSAALIQNDPPAVLVVGGVLWRLVNKDLCQIVEESSSLNDGKISTSFELLYMNSWIGIAKDGDKNAKNASIIRPEDAEYEKYKKMLRRNGGSGKTESGDIVFNILKDILPTGAGIVENPASGIKGILAVTDSAQIPQEVEDDIEDDIEDEVSTSTTEIAASTISDSTTIILDNNIISSTSSVISNISIDKQDNNNLILNQTKPMKIEKIEDIAAKWAELQKNESAASIVTEFITQKLIEKSKEFAAEVKTKDDLVQTVEANKADALKKVSELQASISALTKELSDIRAAQASAELQEKFSSRMSLLDDEFELDDEDRALLADEVKSIDSDESFAKYVGKQKKLMAGKKKKPFVPFKKEDEKMTEEKCVEKKEASVNMQEVVASVTETPNQSISNAPDVQVSLKEKMTAAFKNKTTVGGKKMK